MIKAGISTLTTSKWFFSLVTTVEKDGKTRFNLDHCVLHRRMKADWFILRTIQESFKYLCGV